MSPVITRRSRRPGSGGWLRSRYEIAVHEMRALVVNYRAWARREPASRAGHRNKLKHLEIILWKINLQQHRLHRLRNDLIIDWMKTQ